MKPMIYADNAATTKLDKDALEAMIPWLMDEYGNASQPYSFARRPKKAIAEAREIIAQCINAHPEEIFFTSGGSESDNWAIKGVALAGTQTRRRIITTAIEHHAVLNSCASLERSGWALTHLACDRQGVVAPELLEKEISEGVDLVSVMMANNEIGTIEPIEELSAMAHSRDALFHTDAVQAVGHIPIDVEKLGVDLLSASAHKFNGPKGIGFLYVRKGTPLYSYQDGGAQEGGLRAGTENVASIVGMAVALKNNVSKLQNTMTDLIRLEDVLLENLQGLDYIRNGYPKHIPGSISLSFRGADGEALLHRLDLCGICVSTGSACDSKNTQISHVIRAIGVPDEYAEGTIRISLGKNNDVEEAKMIGNAIKRILETNYE